MAGRTVLPIAHAELTREVRPVGPASWLVESGHTSVLNRVLSSNVDDQQSEEKNNEHLA
jgi:hypothetical protein